MAGRGGSDESDWVDGVDSGTRRWLGIGANVLTGLRLGLTPIYVWAVLDGRAAMGWAAGAVFVYAALSDVLDGRLARRAGSAGTYGRFLDHFADIGFLLAAFGAFVARGSLPWWVPASVAGSFGFYVVDSLRQSGVAQPNLLASRIGHAGGVANYVLVGVLTFNDAAAIGWIPSGWMMLLFVCVPLYSAAAVIARRLGDRVSG